LHGADFGGKPRRGEEWVRVASNPEHSAWRLIPSTRSAQQRTAAHSSTVALSRYFCAPPGAFAARMLPLIPFCRRARSRGRGSWVRAPHIPRSTPLPTRTGRRCCPGLCNVLLDGAPGVGEAHAWQLVALLASRPAASLSGRPRPASMTHPSLRSAVDPWLYLCC